MTTPDTEWEKMIIYDHHIARINRDKEGNIQSIVVDIPPVLKDLLTSRDTYWKERVREERKIAKKWMTNSNERFYYEKELKALDNLK